MGVLLIMALLFWLYITAPDCWKLPSGADVRLEFGLFHMRGCFPKAHDYGTYTSWAWTYGPVSYLEQSQSRESDGFTGFVSSACRRCRLTKIPG